MARSKKGGTSWLAHRMLNPDRARENDKLAADLERDITAKLLRCQECGNQREVVAASSVPAEVRQDLEKHMPVEDYVYCSTCKSYSAQGGWESF